jgi:hypothetical protein
VKKISKGKGKLIGSWQVSGSGHIDNMPVLWHYRLMNAQAQAINRYVTEIDKIYRTGQATEHGYQPCLKTLFEGCFTGLKTPLKDGFTGPKTPLKDGFTGPKNELTITNEPKHLGCGAPDYIITRNSILTYWIYQQRSGEKIYHARSIAAFFFFSFLD